MQFRQRWQYLCLVSELLALKCLLLRKDLMLLWRLKAMMPDGADRVECHLMRRDMEYRLSLRVGKTVVVHETHRTPVAAAERAEEMRRQAKQGELALPTQAQIADE